MELSFDEQHRLGARIRELRLHLGLTQERLGELAEISAGYVAQVETGSAMPSIPALLRIAQALAVPVTALAIALDGETPDERARLISDASALLSACDVDELRLAVRLIAALRTEAGHASRT